MHSSRENTIWDDPFVGVWDWHIPTNTQVCNATFAAMLGYDTSALPVMPMFWLDKLVTEDYVSFVRQLEAFLTEPQPISFQTELRFQTSQGKILYTKAAFRVLEREPSGIVNQLRASFLDISFTKELSTLLQNNEFLQAKANHLASIGGWEYDFVEESFFCTQKTQEIFELPSSPTWATWLACFQHEADRQHFYIQLYAAFQAKKAFVFECYITTPTGNSRKIKLEAEPVSTGEQYRKMLGYVQDITPVAPSMPNDIAPDQRKAFIEYAPVALAMFDTDMRYLAASGKWKQIYQLDDLDLTNQLCYEVMPHLAEHCRPFHQRALQGEEVHADAERYIGANGKEEWLKWIIRPWYAPNNTIGGIIIFTDLITEQQAAKEALIKAKEQAEQAAIAKTQFLSTMSHEIRTPMNAVIGITHLLMQNAREDQEEYLKILKFSAENLLVLINDILDFNKIEAGKIEFEEVDFNLKDLLSNIRAALLQKATDKGIQLKLMIDDDLPTAVKGDSVRIGQIITNLVTNAVKFTEKGKVTITASLVKKDKDTTTINFEVKDTGIGIPKDKWEQIFESFTQASSETTRKFGGTGLGLTITKRLLELQGSHIQLDSTPDVGSKFFFDLTLKNSNHQFKKSDTIFTEQQQRSLKGLKLLIADDNQINIIVAKQFLDRWDITCDVAENGLLALQMVQQAHYDLVLMDLQMPEMDGYQATKHIRQLGKEYFKKVPIIALTASAMLDIKDKAFAVGMTDYISKPFNPDELYRKIALHSGQLASMN